jgi:hypothetical protein
VRLEAELHQEVLAVAKARGVNPMPYVPEIVRAAMAQRDVARAPRIQTPSSPAALVMMFSPHLLGRIG